MNRKYLTVLGLVAVLGLGGCRSVNTVEPTQRVNPPRQIDDKRVVTDPSLQRRVAIIAVNESEGAGGHLRIQVEVLNTTRRYRRFNYKFEWFDRDGILIELPTGGYRSSQLEGGESRMLVSVAPTADAKDFRLQLIENVR